MFQSGTFVMSTFHLASNGENVRETVQIFWLFLVWLNEMCMKQNGSIRLLVCLCWNFKANQGAKGKKLSCIESCIPKKSAFGVYYSQLIRYARLSSKYEDFLLRCRSLVDKLKTQGFKEYNLKRLTSRFFKEKHDILVKYNIPNTDDFFQNIFA